MKIPQKPPPFPELLRKQPDGDRLDAIFELVRRQIASEYYLHWDKLRRLTPPEGFTIEEWWLATKLQRTGGLKAVPLKDKEGKPFRFCIPDRNDLDDQLFGTFCRCHELLRQTPVQAENREHLRQLLQVASGGVVFTTVQKFFPDEKGAKYPTLSECRNIVVIADEAHRSQYDSLTVSRGQ